MPTNKPRIQTIIEKDLYDKFKYICTKETRSESQMTRIIIKEFISNYEKKYGKINIEEETVK